MRTCASGVCGVTYPPTGTLLATQIAGDCAVKVCNGAGIVVGQDDLTDAPPGGNCTTQTCMVRFPGKTLAATSGNAKRIETGDLNGDGKVDVVLVENGISVLFGNGDGTFAPGVPYLPLSGVQAAAIGDLDGDGHLDVVWVADTATVSVLHGNGNGTFAASIGYPCATTLAVVTADLNGDGKLDLALPDGDAVLSLINQGDGTFPDDAPPPYPVARAPGRWRSAI